MANNWAMMGFFLVFLVSLVWLKGVGFFDLRFLGRMFMWALPVCRFISSCHWSQPRRNFVGALLGGALIPTWPARNYSPAGLQVL